MKITAKLMFATLAAAAFALPTLMQHANAASTQSEITDIPDAVNSGLTPSEWHQKMMRGITSRALEGRRVLRANGHSLGFILGVNDVAREVEVQTTGDRAITLPESQLRFEHGQVYAAGTSSVAMK